MINAHGRIATINGAACRNEAQILPIEPWFVNHEAEEKSGR
jgi:hypothetical protein